MRHNDARSDLRSWLDDQPGNFFHATPQLRRLLARLAGEDALDRWAPHLGRFGKVAATELDEAAGDLAAAEQAYRALVGDSDPDACVHLRTFPGASGVSRSSRPSVSCTARSTARPFMRTSKS